MENQSFVSKRKILYADLSLLLVALVWGTGFSVMKGALNNITPFYLLAIRFVLASAMMALILNKKLKRITINEIRGGGMIGAALFIGFALQTTGLQYTDAGKQAFLTGCYVIMVPFLSWLVDKKRPDTYSFVATFLTMIGIALLTINGKDLSMGKGDLLSLTGAMFYAAQVVAIGYFSKQVDPMLLAFIQIFMQAVLFTIMALLFEPIPTSLFSIDIMWRLGYMALFPTVFAFFVQNIAQSITTSTHAALILSLETLFGALTAVAFLNEAFTLQMILGSALIFTAIITAETKLSFLKFANPRLDES